MGESWMMRGIREAEERAQKEREERELEDRRSQPNINPGHLLNLSSEEVENLRQLAKIAPALMELAGIQPSEIEEPQPKNPA